MMMMMMSWSGAGAASDQVVSVIACLQQVSGWRHIIHFDAAYLEKVRVQV